jgi:RHS repeat-associated protein
VKEVESFDAFGAPLDKTWQDNCRLLASNVTSRGFTKHEHLDAHGLIHMNGRAYDPGLGRFLSVDPFVQDVANSQNLNPYSYILNNPLSGTDPTGYNGDFIYGASVATFWGEKEANIIASVEGGCSMCGDASAGIEMVQAIKEGGKEVSQEISKGDNIRVAAVSAILGRAALKALKKLAERKAHRKMVQGRKKDANAAKKSVVQKNGSSVEPSSKKEVAPSDVGAPGGQKDGSATKVGISRERSPDALKHLEETGQTGKELTIDRSGAAARRRENVASTQTKSGMDRDESPPAVFKESEEASVRHVPASDNRSAGAQVGNQIRKLPDGAKVILEAKD